MLVEMMTLRQEITILKGICLIQFVVILLAIVFICLRGC